MNVQIKKLPKSEVELTITVPYEVCKKWEKKALEELNKKVKIAGFRSGHIPEDILRAKVGPEAIKASTLDFVLPQTYSSAVIEHKLDVVSRPQVDLKSEIAKEGDPLVYTARVAVMPEVKVGNYGKIKIQRKPVEVKPESVDETVQLIMDRYAEWKNVDSAAKSGDRAELTFEGFDADGKAIPNTASKNHPVILGSKTMVPGFEDAVLGMKKGETKEFDVTFPKDYHAEPMRSKKARFRITLERLEEKIVRKLDDAWVEKATGRKETVASFKKRVEDSLKSEMAIKHAREHDAAVIGEILKISEAELPEALVNQELDWMLEDQKKHITRQGGLTWEQYLSHLNRTEEDFRRESGKAARERVLSRLAVRHIVRDAKIAVSDEDLKKKIDELAAPYPEEEQKKVRDHYSQDQKAREQLHSGLYAEKLIQMLSKD